MQEAIFRSFIMLSAIATLVACAGVGGTRQASPAYQPRVAPDAAKNPQLPADIQDCQKRISEESTQELGAQQRMVLMRGCLIQRGHIMLN
jgi:hypothetical protein